MNNKELMSQDELKEIMYNYLKPELDKCKEMNGICRDGSQAGGFCWYLFDGAGVRTRSIGARLCDGYWEILNDLQNSESVNIKVYPDHVEFIEDSKFNDFDHDFMYELCLKIKEFVEGNNIKEENNNE